MNTLKKIIGIIFLIIGIFIILAAKSILVPDFLVYNIVVIIICGPASLALFYVAYLFLGNKNKKPTINLTNKKSKKTDPKETTIKKHIKSSNVSYESLVLDNQNRIVRESWEIIKKTVNPETFFSRYDLLLHHSNESIKSDFENQFNQFCEDFLYRYDNAVREKLLSLKTERGRRNNYNKFLENIESYKNRLSNNNQMILNDLILKWESLISVNSNLNVDKDIISSNCVSSEIINTKISNFEKEIPNEVLNLLWFKNGPYKNLNLDITRTIETDFYILETRFINEEPSALDVNLPIEPEEDSSSVGYYPSYKKLNPIQRFKYLNWLKNISSPIDISYVFIFYYGLERYLFTDKANDSVEMIFKLQNYHSENSSFLAYSSDAILIASLIYKRLDWIYRLDKSKLNPRIYASIKCALDEKFEGQDIIHFAKEVGYKNRKYIDQDEEEFLSTLKKLLMKEKGVNYYPVPKELFKEVQTPIPIMLANYSLNFEQRGNSIPDILSLQSIKNDLNLLLQTAEQINKANI